MSHSWITLHRVRFDRSIDAVAERFSAPEAPKTWRFCPSLSLNGDGLPTFASACWGALAIHDDEASARAFLDDPQESFSPFADAQEAWHALGIPVAHHGQVQWGDTMEDGTVMTCKSGFKEGRLAVLTSAGYHDRATADVGRIKAFMAGIEAVVAQYRALEGNRRADVFAGGFDGLEGFTCTLWDDDRAMLSAAYKDGTHRREMDANEHTPRFDRSSFSRLRLIDTRGTWDDEAI